MQFQIIEVVEIEQDEDNKKEGILFQDAFLQEGTNGACHRITFEYEMLATLDKNGKVINLSTAD